LLTNKLEFNMPQKENNFDARAANYGEMWNWFRDKYIGSYNEHELKKIHNKWKRLAKEA